MTDTDTLPLSDLVDIDAMTRQLSISFQILGRSYFKSYEHEMRMRDIVRDGRSKAAHLRAAIKYQAKAADSYAQARIRF
jgi:hypothetical protein